MKDALAGPLGRLNGRVTLWLARCAALVLSLLAVLTFCDVLARYLFSKSFSFTVEATELGMGLIVYLGVGLITHEKGHVAVDFVTIRLPQVAQALLETLVNLLALAYLTFLVWRLFLRAEELADKGDYTPIWHMPLWPVAGVMAIGSVFFLTGVLLHLASAVARLSARREPS